MEVQGTKRWKDIAEQYRPESVTVELWRQTANSDLVQVTGADGNVMKITTNAKSGWTYDFGKLDKYDKNGALYTYVVKETLIDKTPVEETDYKVSAGEGYDLINTIKEETKTAITVKGTKTWVDNNDQSKMRPKEITVNLLRDDKKIDSVQVKADDDGTWKFEFKDLPKYDMADGRLFKYSVGEEKVKNYQTTINGYDITNTLEENDTPDKPVKPEDPDTPDTSEKPDQSSDKPAIAEQPGKPVEKVVKTGDEAPVVGYVFLGIFALAAAGNTLFIRKKNR